MIFHRSFFLLNWPAGFTKNFDSTLEISWHVICTRTCLVNTQCLCSRKHGGQQAEHFGKNSFELLSISASEETGTAAKMLTNFLRRPNYLSQLRKCQTKCAIDREIRSEDGSSVRQSVADKQSDHRNANLNADQIAAQNVDQIANRIADLCNRHNHEANSNVQAKQTGPDDGQPSRGKKRKAFYFEPKKSLDPAVKRAIVKIAKYQKAMGLPDDMPFDEASKLVNEYFDGVSPGLKFFESTGSPIYGECGGSST